MTRVWDLMVCKNIHEIVDEASDKALVEMFYLICMRKELSCHQKNFRRKKFRVAHFRVDKDIPE